MNTSVHCSFWLAPETYPGRDAMEYLALEGYRAGTLSHLQASELLGMSRIAFDGFLKDHHVHDVPEFVGEEVCSSEPGQGWCF